MRKQKQNPTRKMIYRIISLSSPSKRTSKPSAMKRRGLLYFFWSDLLPFIWKEERAGSRGFWGGLQNDDSPLKTSLQHVLLWAMCNRARKREGEVTIFPLTSHNIPNRSKKWFAGRWHSWNKTVWASLWFSLMKHCISLHILSHCLPASGMSKSKYDGILILAP